MTHPNITPVPGQVDAYAGAPQPVVPGPPPPAQAFPAPAPTPQAELMQPSEIKANQKVLFVLDALEREKVAEPFIFEYQGEIFELLDPKDIDWQDLMIGQEQPRLMLHVIMAEDQRARFLEKKLPMWLLEELLTRWQQHFGLPDSGEGDGSARS